MNKLIVFFIYVLGVNAIYAQNTFGIRRVNTKVGTVVDAPRIDSKHYKIQLPELKQDVDIKLLFHEYVDGAYKEGNLNNTMHFTIPKEHLFVMDFVPELQPSGAFKLYIFYPGVTRYCYMFPDKNKTLKFAPYATAKTSFNESLNMLLIYEDNEDGEIERLVNKYIVDGVLNIDLNSDKRLRSMLKRYSVFYYIIDDKKK